ncbi:MAG: hypothetical protein JSR83_26890 [Proteobacteria bacterium]|nr:hypothetical protein [Pseudomonadota bacterium]
MSAHPREHWQDFSAPVTLTAEQAGTMYRAITSVTTTLVLAAQHFTLLASERKDLAVLSINDMEALLAGAYQLAEMARAELEELHG